jgi:hypothetical protein
VSLPERFKCTVTTWDFIYSLCRDVSKKIKSSGYQPDVIVALARGGWFPGRVLCDFLNLDDLTSLKVEHYVGTAAATGRPEIKYPLHDEAIRDKRILIVDDIADTGKSLRFAREHVLKSGPKEVKTASLQVLSTSEFTPDYYAQKLKEWTWVIYPWNFLEDMCDIISRMMKREERIWTIEDIYEGLKENYQIEPIALEIAQPGRLPEVMDELVWRGIVEKEGKGWKIRKQK